MPNKEKVIKKAEHIMCSTVDRDMIDSFCEDVIALLEEQDEQDEQKRNPVIICPHCGKRVK